MWLATTTSNAPSVKGSSWASHVVASTTSMFGSGATAALAASTMPADKSVSVSCTRGSKDATLTQSTPDPQPTSSTRVPGAHSTRPTSQGNHGSSERAYFACSAMRALRLLGSLYWCRRRYSASIPRTSRRSMGRWYGLAGAQVFRARLARLGQGIGYGASLRTRTTTTGLTETPPVTSVTLLRKVYVPFGTVVVFQLLIHPY